MQQTDGEENWTTVGVSENILEASYLALVDGVRYKLLKDGIVPTYDHARAGNKTDQSETVSDQTKE